MATVTKKIRDDFEIWATKKVTDCEWTLEEIEELKEMLRIDFTPGPDQLRAGLSANIASGVGVTAAIDDHEVRYRLWASYFAAEAEAVVLQNQEAV